MNKYLKAITYNFVFFAFSTLAFLVLTPLAIRVMGDEFFGLWSIIFSVAQFTNIGTLGIGSIVNKLASENSCSDSEASNIISSALLITLPMAVVTACLVLLCLGFLVESIKPSITYLFQFKYALIISSLTIIPQFANKVFQGYFLSQIKNRFVRSLEFITSILPLLGGVVISVFYKDLIWLAVLNFFIQVGVLFIFIHAMTLSFKWEWSPKLNTIKRMLGFASFMFLESSAIIFFQQFDRIVVGITLGPVIAGVYTVATSVGLRLTIISGQLTEIMIPYASLKNSLGENAKLYHVFRRLSVYVSIMIAVLASGCLIWIREILSVWISPEYASSYGIFFGLLILAYSYLSLCRPAHQTLTGLGQVKITSLTYLFASIIMILSIFFLSQRFGEKGAASANLVMVILFLMIMWTYKNLNHKLNWRHLFSDMKWGFLLPTMAYLIVLFHISWGIRIVLSILLGAFSYIFIHKDPFIKTLIMQFTQNYSRGKGA